jgi:4,5-dihydroxyphthalate decarboxylase
MEHSVQPLKIALGNYGLTKPLKEGQVPSSRLNLEYVEVKEIVPAMRRMCRNLEYDICEMAFTTYVCARAAGLPFTAVPVFVTRNFHHWAISINAKSGIRQPKDLEGREVAVNRGYTVTTGLWARGILQNEYGVDLDKVTFVPTDDEHVAEFREPKNVDYAKFRGQQIGDLLANQQVSAAIGEIKAASPDIKPLIPDAREAAFGYFRKTGVYPINHGLVVKDSLLKEMPWIADELVRMFEAAKAIYMKDLQGAAGQSSWDKAAAENAAVVGDPFPFGIEANRKALEAINLFAVQQHMVPRKYTVEELFQVPAQIPA